MRSILRNTRDTYPFVGFPTFLLLSYLDRRGLRQMPFLILRMPFVTVILGSGLGNRFFQVAAMLGYAHRHGHTPVFVASCILDNPSHPGPYGIADLFPAIPFVEESLEWTFVDELEEFTYSPFPFRSGNVKLRGSFQSHLYFPPSPIPCPTLLAPTKRVTDTYFLHVRRGDYLHPLCAHHHVSLTEYWRRCVALLPSTARLLVCSEDMEWCKAELPRLLSAVKAHQWRFLDPCDDAATLSAMIGCEAGGVCANSSFSWWAAYWLTGKNPTSRIFMPGTWGHPPMPVARDIWPPWALRIPA